MSDDGNETIIGNSTTVISYGANSTIATFSVEEVTSTDTVEFIDGITTTLTAPSSTSALSSSSSTTLTGTPSASANMTAPGVPNPTPRSSSVTNVLSSLTTSQAITASPTSSTFNSSDMPTSSASSSNSTGGTPSDIGGHSGADPAVVALSVLFAVSLLAAIGLLIWCFALCRRAHTPSRTSDEKDSPLKSLSELPSSAAIAATAGLQSELAKTKNELALSREANTHYAAILPSATRDLTDDISDLRKLNSSILQLAMRFARLTNVVDATGQIKGAVCATLYEKVFVPFCFGLEPREDARLSQLQHAFQNQSSATIWKSMTLSALLESLQDSIPAAALQQLNTDLTSSISRDEPSVSGILASDEAVQQALVEIGKQAAKLSHNLGRDGRANSILYVARGHKFNPKVMETNRSVVPNGAKVLRTEGFGLKRAEAPDEAELKAMVACE